MQPVDAIIQARMGSARLPGKTLEKINGLTLMEQVIQTAVKSGLFRQTILATTILEEDEQLKIPAEAAGAKYFQGPAEDVLRRYILAADEFGSKTIVRLTGDNPFPDMDYLAQMIKTHQQFKADYTYNESEIPLGTACEIFELEALKQIDQLTDLPKYREHVTTYFRTAPMMFHIQKTTAPDYLVGKKHRLTVDVAEDLQLVREVAKVLASKNAKLTTKNAVILLDHMPDLSKTNQHVQQKDWQ